MARRLDGENTFRSALQADRVVSMILDDVGGVAKGPTGIAAASPQAKGFWARLFG